ncbi:MAG: hypothetical protein AVO35_09900 [Candidatus Aegiribacteria sp. MLS_C]|nr:MAG: hypothetical protein AVO35_09900 [Candidatus Aegiribacteria sp. MLS_C]
MPELPDVETFRRYLAYTSLHKKIVKVHLPGKELIYGITATTLRRHLLGRVLNRTERHGKHMFAGTDAGEWLLLHFGMTGFLKYYRDEDGEPGHPRLILDFDNGYHLAYDDQRKLGRIGLVMDIDGYIERRNLGPDALGIDLETFLKAYEDRRGAVKSALMDQSAMAGIGNIYADEILYQAGINPETRVAELDDDAMERLFRNMNKVLKKAVECGAKPDCLPDSYLIPHRTKGGTCPRCGREVTRTKVSGRTTYYCPYRQGG